LLELGDWLPDADTLGEMLALGDTLGEIEADGDCEALGLTDGETLGDSDADGDLEAEGETLALGDWLADGEIDALDATSSKYTPAMAHVEVSVPLFRKRTATRVLAGIWYGRGR
jgi:hypothetical protein